MSDILSKFMNIWDVETHFKCPVVGAVLSVEKHKTILKKCGYKVSEMKPYEFHQNIMAKLHEENPVSVKVNNFIRSRARKWMTRVAGKSNREIRDLWKQNLESGNVGPLMYAIISYEETAVDLLHDVYGEVHMKAHANMTGIFDVRQKLTKAEAAVEREKKKVASKSLENKKLAGLRKTDAKRISGMEAENGQLKKQVVRLEGLVSPEESGKTIISQLEEQVAALTAKLESRTRALLAKERENQSLQIKYLAARKEKKNIRREVDTLVGALGEMALPPCQTESCAKESCEQYQLCARRIFMIGGITKMKAYYKDIVEKAGGEFDYHDGYMKNANTDLEAKVKKSDLVLCPVNCNSHTACTQVKKLCNLHNTPLKILSSSSLSAVSQAVFSSEGSITLN
ncbi:DUF2325 domain-containing protein [Desulfospira joergensenii]|uniref:DUF2325 domain-containing protein n=1 Tax=Desulfospira joergensenii TaxID=53329 RepID=UPI0003B3FA20|nr:DUF2325 domain-containing protein [Desulfospira joergensenii]